MLLQALTSGKLQRRLPVEVATAGPFANSLFFTRDKQSQRHFLIDTGSEVSAMPATYFDHLTNTHGWSLSAANGTTIHTYSSPSLLLQLGDGLFQWNFLIADIECPILGSDFLSHTGLLVDMRNQQLVDPTCLTTIPLHLTEVPGVHLIADPPNEYQKLLAKYPSLITPTFSAVQAKHRVRHHIQTTGPPRKARAQRLPPDKLAVAKAEFEKMQQLGIIRRSSSQHSSPLHMVSKADGGTRPCVTFNGLMMLRYPIATWCHIFKISLPTSLAK